MEVDSIAAIYWITEKERGSWRFDATSHHVSLYCYREGVFFFFFFFCWYPHLSNQVVDFLAKRGAKLFESFVGTFLPPSIIIRKHLVCWIILVSSLSLQLVMLHFVEHSSCFFIRFCTLWKDLLDLFIEYK